jgi:hypothetical protein
MWEKRDKMPIYNTVCPECGTQAPRKITYGEYDHVVKGEQSLAACLCGGFPAIVFDPSTVSFVLKDGESGGWSTKASLENKHRARRRDRMAQRERDHVRPHDLVPNYGGQIAGTWEEAKDAAYQSTYAKVNSESGSKVAAQVAQKSASTYDRHIRKEAK